MKRAFLPALDLSHLCVLRGSSKVNILDFSACLDRQSRSPARAGLGSFLVTLGLVPKADGECGWLAKSLEAQECRSDSS